MTIGLVVLVTGVLTAILVLISRTANRLQERLTFFFSSRRFATRYPAALVEKHRRLKLIGIYNPADPHPPLLQQVYVTLREVAAGGEEGPQLAWSEIFQPGEKRLVILGSPGAGKSTLLDELVLVFTGHLNHPLRFRLSQLFPLFAQLRELGAGSLQALLAQAGPSKVPADFPERRLRSGGCLVLLDGLDEVLGEERHAWAVKEIERLTGEYPDNYYVITCRTSGWHNQLPGFRTYEIQPFTRDGIRRFIAGWYSAVLQAAEPEALAGAVTQAGELWQSLEARADLLQIASTPLLLKALLARSSEPAAELETAGLALAEDVQLGADLQGEIRYRLLDRLSRKEAAGPFRRLDEALRAADLAAARGWMEEELHGSDPLRLRQVLELLPGLGGAYVKPLSAVILRLAGESADLGVRTAALQSLGGLQMPFEPEVRQVLERARQEREPQLRNAAAWAWCELGRPEDLGLVKVPAGEFLMGSADEKYQILVESPQHMLFLPGFYIGRYPVTVGAFSEYLAMSGRKIEKEDRFRQWNRQEDHPVVRVSWTDAADYARWHGMSLPSEAEWEKAARGTDGRRYPWGNEWKPGHANTLENWPSRGKATTTPAGAFSPQGDSPYGCSDMAGNVWEWTRCVDGPYPYDPTDGREDFGASLTGWQIMRGGALDRDSRHARCAVRACDDPRDHPRYVGFRLVLVPFPPAQPGRGAMK